jgi:hypothetical protein
MVTVKRERLREDLQLDIATELCVAGARDLAHSPFAKEGHDFIGTEPGAAGMCHGKWLGL